MNRKRVIYIGLLVIALVIVGITYFSYAFLTKVDEQHGKLNIVVGTLDYKIESDDLDSNNSITVDDTKMLDINITSLNDTESKYELFYTATRNDVVVEYMNDSNYVASTGIIPANGSIDIRVKIIPIQETTITFNLKSGLKNNELEELAATENSIVEVETIEAPVITGGTGTSIWSATSKTITLSNPGSASSGIKSYEYYKSTSSTEPDENTTATGTITSSPYSLTVSDEGITYIYYRLVTNRNLKSEWSNAQVIKVDSANPNPGTLASAPSTTNSITANYGAASAVSGIKSTNCYYGTSNDPTTAGTLSGNNCVFSSLTANTTYYFKKCVTNNADTTACSTVSSKPTAGQVYNYAYTGGVQSLTAPYAGTYKFEVWGAQGGDTGNNVGNTGYGGYSVGTMNISKNTALYVVVGGQGQRQSATTGQANGGYNGGGRGGRGSDSYYSGIGQYSGGAGGGATHIATTNRGVLANYNSYRSELLIVAGGGGGGGARTDYGVINGGSGGGISGVSGGYASKYPTYYATGGSQSAGGVDQSGESGASAGSFGQGSNFNGIYGGSGGGGGYFGGGGTNRNHSGAGGGSGYIGNSSLTNKQMYCYNCATSTAVATKTVSGTCVNGTATANCAKSGSGYARITITYIN